MIVFNCILCRLFVFSWSEFESFSRAALSDKSKFFYHFHQRFYLKDRKREMMIVKESRF